MLTVTHVYEVQQPFRVRGVRYAANDLLVWRADAVFHFHKPPGAARPIVRVIQRSEGTVLIIQNDACLQPRDPAAPRAEQLLALASGDWPRLPPARSTRLRVLR